MQGVVADDQDLLQSLDDFLCHGCGILTVPHIFKQDHEFVPTQTGQGVPFPNQRLQAIGCGLQHAVADGMPKTVVDRLEPIQIDKQQGQPDLPRGRPG